MMKTVVESVASIFTGRAYTLTILSGLLTITMERYLYRRRNYQREARITAFLGWTYIIGGTVLYILIAILAQIFT